MSQDPELLRRLLRAKDRMDAASHEEWPVRRIARVSGVSEAHFARSFKEAFGVPPHRYLPTRRIERAPALRRETDLTVTEIAFQTAACTPTYATATTVGSRCSTASSRRFSSACSNRSRRCSTRRRRVRSASSWRREPCRRSCWRSTTAAPRTTECARGVEFTQEPVERYGTIDAGFRDPSGNGWKMIEPRR